MGFNKDMDAQHVLVIWTITSGIADTVSENDLTVAAVFSGNRNFEGRVHPQVSSI